MNDIILLKQGEIVLKGLNRREFERRLLDNIRRRLKPIGNFRVYAMQSTVYIEPDGNQEPPSTNMDDALEAVKSVFGITSLTHARACEKDKDIIVKTAAEYLQDEILNAKTFKVESKRSDKNFPMTSIELSQYAGGELHEMYPHLTADMHSPELHITIEVRDLAAYVHGKPIRGAGGLPVGTGGKMAALLSGGIDSPVALYRMARRGVQLYPIHFYSPPYTSVQAKDKVDALAQILERYCGTLNTKIIPFTKIQEEISKRCPEPLMTVIMRRFMMRIAERIAIQNGCTALVTGDNLGQVASQTAQALAAAEHCVSIPVFRPLLAFDKTEIMDIARRIGTYETSILPFEDCCTVFTPRRPKTKPKLYEVEAAEAKLDVDALVEEALIGM